MESLENDRRPGRRWARLALGVLVVVASCGGDDVDDAVEEAADEVSAEADQAAEAAESESAELATVLRDNGLDSVASAVELVDFKEVVDAPEFTFFAPNDTAFQSLSADELADLLADPSAVAEVLRNHTVDAKVLSSDLTDGLEIETEAGGTLTVTIDGDTVMIGAVTVVQADLDVNDGVIHVVDGLLIP